MARCYACNCILENGYDKKTDRSYCEPCFEATNKVLLANLELDSESPFDEHFALEDWVTDNLYPTDAEVDIIKDLDLDE